MREKAMRLVVTVVSLEEADLGSSRLHLAISLPWRRVAIFNSFVRDLVECFLHEVR